MLKVRYRALYEDGFCYVQSAESLQVPSFTPGRLSLAMLTSSRAKVMLLLSAALAAVLTVSATQVMHRPDTYKEPPHKTTQGNATPHVIHKRSGAKAQIAYFTNWSVVASYSVQPRKLMVRRGIYGADFRRLQMMLGYLSERSSCI